MESMRGAARSTGDLPPVQHVAALNHLADALADLRERVPDSNDERDEAQRELEESARLRSYTRKLLSVVNGEDALNRADAFRLLRVS